MGRFTKTECRPSYSEVTAGEEVNEPKFESLKKKTWGGEKKSCKNLQNPVDTPYDEFTAPSRIRQQGVWGRG